MKDEKEGQRWRNGGRDTMTKRRMDETAQGGESGTFLRIQQKERQAAKPHEPGHVTCRTAPSHLRLVGGGEHGHLHVLSTHRFGLARGRRPGGLLVVAAHANEEEKQGDGQRDGHAGNQDVQDLHVAAARLVFMVWEDSAIQALLQQCNNTVIIGEITQKYHRWGCRTAPCGRPRPG